MTSREHAHFGTVKWCIGRSVIAAAKSAASASAIDEASPIATRA